MIYNVELEQSILACLLIDRDISQEIGGLVEEDFQEEINKKIFKTMKRLAEQGERIDFMTVYEKLGQTVPIEYLTRLADSLPGVTGFPTYVRQLKDLTNRRKLISLADTVAHKARNGEDDAIEYAEKEIYMIRGDTGIESFTTPREHVLSICEDIEKRISSNKTLSGLDSGFNDINLMTDGLQNEDVIILAARPSMGKTSLALNIAQNVGANNSMVAIFSLEMNEKALIKRMMLSQSGIGDIKIRTKRVGDEDWKSITNACNTLYNQSIYICDKASVTVAEMLSMARKLKMKVGKLDLVIIDYLQLLKGEGNGRTEQITNISISLKCMAKELGCPLLVLSQLSRGCEQRENKRPMLSDLRESGQIEQDADVVMLLYRDEYYNIDSQDKGIAEVIFAKQRNGPTGTVKIGFIDDIMTFVDILK